MSSILNKPVPLVVTILITITATVTITVEAAKAGYLNFIGLGPADDLSRPLINGTIINNDNKTYGVLIVPKNITVDIPEPIPPPVNDTPPIPIPEPIPTCEPDEVYNTTSKLCEEIPEEQCTPEQIYNPDTNKCDPKPVPVPVPPTCPEDQKYNTTTQKCEPVVIPNPEPEPVPIPIPTPTSIKIAVVGDVEDGSAGNSVFNQIKAQNPNDIFVLGDLGYEESLTWFKGSYGSLGDKTWCVMGNHEDEEEDADGNTIEDETLKYCGNSYWLKRGVNLFVVLNTNDPSLSTLDDKTVKIFSNATIMQGVKNVHFVSHKPYATSPNSHHPVESGVKTLYDNIKSKIPAGIKTYYIAAHNHVLASTADGTFKLSGAGGRSHHECSTSTTWTFCNNSNYGFLILTLQSDGIVKYQFVDYNGRILKQG